MIRTWMIACLAALLVAGADGSPEQLTRSGIREFSAAFAAWNGDGFGKAADQFRKAGTLAQGSPVNFYWQGAASFHRMLYYKNRPVPDARKADEAMRDAMQALEQAIEKDPRHAESHALLGTLYGMKIEGGILRAIRYGPRVQKHQQIALASGAGNPRVMYLYGTGLYHTARKPEDYRKALATLTGAEQLFLNERKRAHKPFEPLWGLSSCRTFIGLALVKLDRKQEAAAYFRKALAEHPNDHVAKRQLALISPA